MLKKVILILFGVLLVIGMWCAVYHIRDEQIDEDMNAIHGIDTEAFEGVVSVDGEDYETFIKGKKAGDTFSAKVELDSGKKVSGVRGYVVVGDNDGFIFDDRLGILKVVI